MTEQNGHRAVARPGRNRRKETARRIERNRMTRIYIIPTDGLPPDTGYLEIMAMTEDDIVKLPHVTLTLSEFENEWNDDLKGQFDSTRQFIRVF